MPYVDWKIHGDETLAAYLPDKEFTGLLEKRIAVAPDHIAILIRDGQLVQAFPGAHFSVGGIWQRMKEFVGGSHALRLLVGDLKPFQVTAGLEGFSRDHVEIRAELALEMQLNPEKPVDIMGLVANGRSLTKSDVYNRIRPHLQERIFANELVQHGAADLRGNTGLQDRIQSSIMKEVERIAGDMGLMVRSASTNWAKNEDEAQAIKIRGLEREDEFRDFEYERKRREIDREAETTIFRIRSDIGIEKARKVGEAELEQLILSNKLALEDARATGQRIQDRKQLQHELEVAKEKRLDAYDTRIRDEENELERKKIELERKKLENAFAVDTRKLELELRKLEQMQELEVAGAGQDLQVKKLRDLQDLEMQKTGRMHDLSKDEYLTKHAAEMEAREQAARAELDKMKLQAGLSPDQILAIQAGASPEIAKVFAEKARSAGVDKEALLREMLEMSKQSKVESAAQAQAMFDRAVDRLAQVGSSMGAAVGGAVVEGATPLATGGAECPKCHFRVPPGDRFCKNCGHQMRT